MASLNQKIDWTVALRELGSRLIALTLPSSCVCPICRTGRLKLTQDIASGGAWGKCSGCQFSGDMIDLASQAWRTDAETAVRRLQSKHAISAGVRVTSELSRRQKGQLPAQLAGKCVEQAFQGTQVVYHQGARRLLKDLQLGADPSVSWARSGLGRLMGYTASDTLEDTLRPRRNSSPRRNRPRPPRIAPETAEDCLVVPFYDVPGRVSSIGIIHAGKQSRWEEKTHTVDQLDNWQDGGLAIHPDCHGSQLLMTEDLELYVRMQAKHFNQNTKPLPLGCYRDQEPATANWQAVASREIVFWAPTMSPRTLWQAIRLDAKLVTSGPRFANTYEYVKSRTPSEVVKKCLANAVAWPEIIIQATENKEPEVLADWLGEMDLSEQEKHVVVDACPLSLRKKLKQALDFAVSHQSIAIGSGFIEQRTTGWYYLQGDVEHLVTNSPFRIVEAVAGKAVRYRIEAKFARQTFRFTAEKKVFSERPFELVQQQAISQGLGVPTFDPKWQRQAAHIALQLHTPKVTAQAARVGVSNDRRRLELPGLSLDLRTGRVKRRSRSTSKLPGGTLQATRRKPRLIRDFIQADTTHLSVYAALLSQVLANMAETEVPVVTLQGRQARSAGEAVAAAMGVLTLDGTYAQLDKKLRRHAWPATFSDLSQPVRSRLLTREQHHGLILPATPTQALYGLLKGDTTHVRGRGSAAVDCSILRHWTVELLRYACEHQQLALLHAREGTLAGTLRLMAKWASDNGLKIDRKVWRAAERACLCGLDVGEEISRAAARLIHHDYIHLQPWNGKPTEELAYRMPKSGDVFMPRNRLLEAIRESGAPQLDINHLLIRIGEASTRLESRLRNSVYGFVIKRKDFDRHLNICRRTQHQLRVISA